MERNSPSIVHTLWTLVWNQCVRASTKGHRHGARERAGKAVPDLPGATGIDCNEEDGPHG